MSVDPTDCPECAGYHPGQTCEGRCLDCGWLNEDCECEAS